MGARRENDRRTRGAAWVAAAAGLLSLAATGANFKAPEGNADVPAGPHWSSTGCGACHVRQGGSWLRPKQEEIDLLCLRCHDGRTAAAEPHPVGRRFAGPQVRRPVDWPAPDDRLSCITCHDVLPGCRPGAAPPSRPAAFLRGPEAAGTIAWCATCHVAELHAPLNPHRMLDGSGRPRAGACAVCHESSVTTAGSGVRRQSPSLRCEEVTLCGGCHRAHEDFFTPGHIGATASDSILARLTGKQVEGAPPSAPLLPLAGGTIVTCSTCHNPHSSGLFPPDSSLAMGAMTEATWNDTSVALRIPGGGLCQACHGP
ncbi:MAG: hypothetical protein HY763_10835 [Planctomycetes bacterium]|nr:hypothetical protein [Planctomycetota bacterium]